MNENTNIISNNTNTSSSKLKLWIFLIFLVLGVVGLYYISQYLLIRSIASVDISQIDGQIFHRDNRGIYTSGTYISGLSIHDIGIKILGGSLYSDGLYIHNQNNLTSIDISSGSLILPSHYKISKNTLLQIKNTYNTYSGVYDILSVIYSGKYIPISNRIHIASGEVNNLIAQNSLSCINYSIFAKSPFCKAMIHKFNQTYHQNYIEDIYGLTMIYDRQSNESKKQFCDTMRKYIYKYNIYDPQSNKGLYNLITKCNLQTDMTNIADFRNSADPLQAQININNNDIAIFKLMNMIQYTHHLSGTKSDYEAYIKYSIYAKTLTDSGKLPSIYHNIIYIHNQNLKNKLSGAKADADIETNNQIDNILNKLKLDNKSLKIDTYMTPISISTGSGNMITGSNDKSMDISYISGLVYSYLSGNVSEIKSLATDRRVAKRDISGYKFGGVVYRSGDIYLLQRLLIMDAEGIYKVINSKDLNWKFLPENTAVFAKIKTNIKSLYDKYQY